MKISDGRVWCACTVPASVGKHEEAQAHAIGRAGRLFIYLAHIIHGRRSQTIPDLHDDERQAEEGHE